MCVKRIYNEYSVKKMLYWLPRIFAILYILFFSIFALDVFSDPHWFIALFMHLIPSSILLIITIVAWKRARLGGILFFLAGICISIFYHSFAVAVPAFVISVLFLSASSIKKT